MAAPRTKKKLTISEQNKKLAKTVSLTCPTLANFYLLKSKVSSETNDKANIFKKCSFCMNAFTTCNRSIRLLPKPALSHKIKKLLQKYNSTSTPLGKFQTKLVQDYINRKNTLVVSCLVCKKRRKFPCQSRSEKLRQFQESQTLAKMASEDTDLSRISSRKERKRERRKLMKNKREGGEIDADKYAGLIIPESLRMVEREIPDRNNQDKQEHSCEEISEQKNHTNLSKRLTVLEKRRNDMLDFQKERTECAVLKASNLSQRPKFVPSAGIQQSFSSAQTQGGKKSSNKTNISKKRSQQLSNMLKQEKKKQSGGTLADFLSSL